MHRAFLLVSQQHWPESLFVCRALSSCSFAHSPSHIASMQEGCALLGSCLQDQASAAADLLRSRRPTALAPVIERHVLGKLDLAAWQALSQTCRRFRSLSQTTQAGSCLSALAQVAAQSLAPAVPESGAWLTAPCLQAQLPTLCSEGQLRGELDGVAASVAAVRRGTPTVAREVVFWPSEVQGLGKLVPGYSLLSPSGDAAAVAWEREDESEGGVLMAHASGAANAWLVIKDLAAAVPLGANGDAAKAFSPSNRWLGSLHCSEEHGVWAMLYDIQQREWLHAVQVSREDAVVKCDPVSFTDCESMAAAVYLTYTRELETVYTIAVWGCGQPWVQVLPSLGKSHAWGWLPGTTSLLVWSDCRLARVDLYPAQLAPGRLLQPVWAQLPAQVLAGSFARLGFLPGAAVAASLHCRESTQTGRAGMELALHCTVRLKTLSRARFTLSLLGEASVFTACALVTASARAVAATFLSPHNTIVFSVVEGRLLGKRLFSVLGMSSAAFHVSGTLITGCVAAWT